LGAEVEKGSKYVDSFMQLARRIRGGASFSGRERNCAFLNVGGETFADASAALGLDLEEDSRGMAVCDWDHDGDIDLWLTNRTAPKVQMLQNGSGGRSVSFLLEGDPTKGCPRDAAGARVVLEVGGELRTRTVHLGDGFLSQSSRWLVFGLGEGILEKVRVVWPGGAEEEFTGAMEGGRLFLKQGSGKVELVGSKGKALPKGEAVIPGTTEQGRIWLSKAASFSGMKELPEKAVFLNLWASWCEPCLTELREFGEAKDVPVVYLNVEGAEKITEAKMKEVLKEAGVIAEGKFAEEEVIGELSEIIAGRIYRHRNLPIPTTFLLDEERRVRAIYKGPVSAAVLRRDLKRVGQAEEEHLNSSVPFAGKWSGGLADTNPISVASAYQEGGYFEDARAYLFKYLSEGKEQGEAGRERRADVRLKLGQLHRAEGNYAAAEQQLGLSLEASPGRIPSRILRALTLAELGRKEEALKEVAILKSKSPGNANFINLEGEVFEILGEDAMAVRAYREVLRTNQRYVPAIHSLASLLATSPEAGVRDGAEALRLATFLSGAPGAGNQPDFVTTLADAHAEAGNFEKALLELERVRALVGKYAGDDVMDPLERRTELFRARKTFSRRN